MQTFQAVVVRQENNKNQVAIEFLSTADLPAGEVLVAVEYSGLNYKDGLALTGKGKIIREFPMVPGVDFAGTVVESHSPDYRVGDPVILTGWGVGERHWGGYAQYARVPAAWLVPLPVGMTTQQAMVIGTAGLTAMLAIRVLEEAGLTPAVDKPVLVTGASGGVGSFAVVLLAQLGYHVTAVTGRPETHAYLTALGAKDFIGRAAMSTPPRPLETQRWAAAVDTVGGVMLARVLAEMDRWGACAACGLVGSAELPTTVMPFILRGVKLLGVDSVACPKARRMQIWQRLANELSADTLNRITAQVVTLRELPQLAEAITQGQIRGRVVVNPNG